ncbi:MAG: DUF58 domain-containing protein [Planctomycetes bacterium]|nr:DUF58 domain-containing protein [Planctomycetota bacterium]
MSSTVPTLPCPAVRFGEDFARRLDALHARLAAGRQVREGAAGARLAGGGEEFAGHRPYRPGEDLRQLDWALYARLDKPFVRVTQREAGETWAVLLDASGSMGVGPPGKLQRAPSAPRRSRPSVLRQGARVALLVSRRRRRPPPRPRRAARTPARRSTLLGGLRAAGAAGLAQLLRARALLPRRAARVLLVGDLCDVAPRDVLALARARRALGALQLLAPAELEPALGARRLWDPRAARSSCSTSTPSCARRTSRRWRRGSRSGAAPRNATACTTPVARPRWPSRTSCASCSARDGADAVDRARAARRRLDAPARARGARAAAARVAPRAPPRTAAPPRPAATLALWRELAARRLRRRGARRRGAPRRARVAAARARRARARAGRAAPRAEPARARAGRSCSTAARR